MDLFRKAGDWFRGAFNGNDDEERKRREREQREREARARQQQQQPKDMRSFFQKAKDTVSIGDDKSWSNPNQTTKRRTFMETVGDRFEANSPQDQAKRLAAGQPRLYQDQIKARTEQRLQSGEIKKPEYSAPARSIARVATGVAQTAPGLWDLLTPGKGTNRVSQMLDRAAKFQDEEAKKAGQETAYKIGNVVGELFSYAIPSKTASTIAKAFPKGAKLTEDLAEKASKLIGGDEAGKVRKFLADRVRRNMTLEEALEEAAISSRYMGQNTGRGGDTSVQSVGTDIAAGIGGGLLFPGGRNIRKAVDDGVADEAVGGATTAAAKAVDEIFDEVDNKGVRNATEEELEAIVDDINRPAVDRKPAADELERRAKEAADAAKTPTPEQTAFQHKQDLDNIVREETGRLQEFVEQNPQLTNQQLEAARKATQERIIRLTDELKESRRKVVESVDNQADEIAAAQDAQKVVKQEVADNAAARTTPDPQDVVQGTPPPSTSPEVDANNVVRRTDEDVLYENAPTFDERGRLSVPQLLSPDRVVRENVTRPGQELVQKAISNAQTSTNPISRTFGRLFSGFSSEAGKSADILAASRRMHGGIETGKLYRESIADLGKNMDATSKQRVWSTLDPEQAQKVGFDVADDLTPEEVVYQQKLKEIIDYTTQEHLRRGNITPEQAANGDYIKRAYSVFEEGSDVTKAYNESKSGLLNQLRGRKEVNEELLEQAVTDPGYLVAKKTAESHALWAMQDYGKYLADAKIASDVPRPGFVQLEASNIFGEAAGKWVPRNVAEEFSGFQYTSGMLNSWNDLITAYDNLGIRQAKKQLLTIFNPAVRVGNQFSNRVVFSNFNGINPVQFNIAMDRVKDMKAQGHQLYREAVEQGLTGIDITQVEFAKRLADTTDSNIARKGIEWMKKSYSAADDQSRIAAYVVKREQGYSPAEAARQVQSGFQDYQSVGFFYDMAAKTPVIGNAFVRFVGDSVRIAKNTAVEHPIRAASTIAIWANLVNIMSKVSGESEEDKDTREGRFGAPQIPFTDISLTMQTPYGEVNVARFIPMYALNEIGNEASRFLPFQQSPVTIEDGKVGVDGAGFQDPLLGQAFQMLFDKDFRNKSIADPDNVTFDDGTTKYQEDPLSDEDKLMNRLRFLFTQNAPLGREIDAIASSTGTQLLGGAVGSPDEKREDIYGKKRDPLQAILRAVGIKNEQFGAEEAAETRNTEAYFDRRDEIEAEVAEMSPDAQAAYRRLTGQYNLREQKPNLFKPGETSDKNAPIYDWSEQKWGEYMQHPELFELMEKRAQKEAQANKSPLNPIFDPRLPKSFRYQLLQQRSIAPGDDLELQQRMYEHPLWDDYQAIKDEYSAKAKDYYPERDNDEGFVDEMVKHQDAKFPEKPPLWKAYLDARNRGEKPQWNDALKAARTEYENAKLNWTNRERAVRGLDPIPAEQWFNSTFGYDPDADRGGFGFGGGGGGGRRTTNNLGELTNFTGSVDPIAPIEVQAMPQLAQLFATLRAGRGGSRRKPTLGASSRGQG